MWPREKCRTSHAFFLLSFGGQLKSPRRYKVTCTHTAVTTSVCTAFPKKKNLTENDNQSEVACDLHAVVWVSMSARSSVTHTHAFGYQRRRRRRPYTVVVVVRVSGEGRNREGFLNSLLKRSRSACGQQNKTFRFFGVFFSFFLCVFVWLWPVSVRDRQKTQPWNCFFFSFSSFSLMPRQIKPLERTAIIFYREKFPTQMQ